MAELAGGFVADPEPSLAGGFVPDAAPAAPPEIGAGRAFALQATNVFGAAPVISGLLAKLQGGDYTTARNDYQAQIDAAKEQHPYASGAGSVASFVPETVLGGAVGKLAGAGAKAAGLASKAAPFIESHPIIAKALHGAIGGAGYGAATAAGTAASKGKDVLPEAAEGALTGGALGGAVGGIAGKVGEFLDSGIAKQNESLVRGAAERALPRQQKALAKFIETDADLGATAKKATIGVSDVLQENRELLKGLRGEDYQKVSEARQSIEDKIRSYEPAKATAYAAIDNATGGGVDAGDIVEALKNKAARVTERPYRSVLETKAKQLVEDFGSISTDEAKAKLLASVGNPEDQAARDELTKLINDPTNRSEVSKAAAREELAKITPDTPQSKAVVDFANTLPEGKQWTARDLLNHAVGGDVTSANFDPNVRKAIQALPFQFDPKLKIPTQEVRSLLTASQEEAESALGTLNATKSAKLASQNQQVIGQVFGKTLDAAKATGIDGIDQAVQDIYDTNLRQSTLLKLNEGAAHKEDKLKLAKAGLGSSAFKAGVNLFAGHELIGAGSKALSGDFGGAAADLGKAAAFKLLPGAAKNATTVAADAAAGGQRALLALQAAASRGNQKAAGLLASIKSMRTLGTAAAGVVGGVTAGTLGQENQ